MPILSATFTLGKNPYSHTEDFIISSKIYTSLDDLEDDLASYLNLIKNKKYSILNLLVFSRDTLDSQIAILRNDTWKNPLKILDIINKKTDD